MLIVRTNADTDHHYLVGACRKLLPSTSLRVDEARSRGRPLPRLEVAHDGRERIPFNALAEFVRVSNHPDFAGGLYIHPGEGYCPRHSPGCVAKDVTASVRHQQLDGAPSIRWTSDNGLKAHMSEAELEHPLVVEGGYCAVPGRRLEGAHQVESRGSTSAAKSRRNRQPWHAEGAEDCAAFPQRVRSSPARSHPRTLLRGRPVFAPIPGDCTGAAQRIALRRGAVSLRCRSHSWLRPQVV